MDTFTAFKEWNDEEVYKHFKLSEDDIKLINDTIPIGCKNIIKQPNITTENEVIEVKPKVKKLIIVKPKRKLVIIEEVTT